MLEHSLLDTLIHAEVLFPHNGQFNSYTVQKIYVNKNGELSGQYDSNPLLNSIIYDVEFSDGTVKEYCANVIAQNLYTIMETDETEG